MNLYNLWDVYYKKANLRALLESSELSCSQIFWVFFLGFVRNVFTGGNRSMGTVAVLWWPVPGVKKTNQGTNFCHWKNSRKQSFPHQNFF